MPDATRWTSWLARRVAPPADPRLDPFRDAVGVLRLNGVEAGRIATWTSMFWGPNRLFGLQEEMWLFVWWVGDEPGDPTDPRQLDEDYPPWVLRPELEQGTFHDFNKNTTYDIEWLTGDKRDQARKALGVTW